MTSLLALFAALPAQQPTDAELVPLEDGYVRVVTDDYSVEIPQGWSVSSETAWGQRKIEPPQDESGELGAMAATVSGDEGWSDLYRTSLYFILRETEGDPTPYKLTETKQGYEAASFSILDENGFAKERYMLLKSDDGSLLALDVKIPNLEREEELDSIFKRMVQTAKIK